MGKDLLGELSMKLAVTRLVLIIGLVCSNAVSGVGATEDLTGCWVGRIVMNGESTEVRVGVVPGEDGLFGTLDIMAMGAKDIPIGPVSQDGSMVRFGPIELANRDGILRGILPKSIDSADELRVTFRRSPFLASDCDGVAHDFAIDVIWETDLEGGVWAAPVVDAARNQLVFGTLDGVVASLDWTTGENLWTTKLDGSVRSKPVMVGNTVFVASDDGMLSLIDARSGEIRQRLRIAEPSEPAFREAPGADFHFRGHQLLGLEDGVAVGTLDGKILIVSESGAISDEGPTLSASITAIAQLNSSLIVGTMSGDLVAMGKDLDVLWTYTAAGAVHGDILATEDGVYVGDRAFDLQALKPSDGSILWKRKIFFSWIESGFVIEDGVLFVGSSDSRTSRAIDPATGVDLWVLPVEGWAWATPRVVEGALVQGVAGTRAYIAPHRPGIVVADPVSGIMLARMDSPFGETGVSGVVADPVEIPGSFVVAETSGWVRALRLRGDNPPSPNR